jgi:2-amino-4-hydroxy-6-hydroxymethyldihydropteridine diphosphokinase
LEGIISYIGIGSNLGDPFLNCKEAVEKLSRADEIHLEKVSSFYRTEPVMVYDQPVDEYSIENIENRYWFINAVAEIRTRLQPRDLLGVLQNIENKMGRKRTFKGAPRIIDLDLLFYGQDVINQEGLVVPHPEISKRRFVLEPLQEIASFYIHPVFGVSVRGLKDRLNDKKSVEILKV